MAAQNASLYKDFDRKVIDELTQGFNHRSNAKQMLNGPSPIVRGNDCSTTVERLYDGPADVDYYLENEITYTDSTFTADADSMYAEDQIDEYYYEQFEDYLDSGVVQFTRWSEMDTDDGYEDYDVFYDHSEPRMSEVAQGYLGNCYIIASMSAAAEFPELIYNAFVTQTPNDEGIYAVQFYIRGKPWVITIDDYMVTYNSGENFLFSEPSEYSMWGPLMEKAWAKLKGTYVHADGGYIETGLRALTGNPVFWEYLPYFTEDEALDLWYEMEAADEYEFLLAAGTSGGSDTTTNDCGIANGHAYSIVSVFSITIDDDDDTDDDYSGGDEIPLLLLRNPWGITYYEDEWYWNDDRWYDYDYIDQVPYDIDPTTDDVYGYFVMPYWLMAAGECLNSIQMAHMRDDDGYQSTWYDQEDVESDSITFTYYIEPTSNEHDIYISAESYFYQVVPIECIQGYAEYTDIFGYDTSVYTYYPSVALLVYQDDVLLDYMWYDEVINYPIILYSEGYDYNVPIEIQVTFETWVNSPDTSRDFTVKAYASEYMMVFDEDYETNMIFMNGTSPSGFTDSDYEGYTDDDFWYDWDAESDDDSSDITDWGWSDDETCSEDTESEDTSTSYDTDSSVDLEDVEVNNINDIFANAESWNDFMYLASENLYVFFTWVPFEYFMAPEDDDEEEESASLFELW